MIEIAARLSGSWFSTDPMPLATGVDLMGAAIKIALGEDLPEEDLIPRYQKGVAIRNRSVAFRLPEIAKQMDDGKKQVKDYGKKLEQRHGNLRLKKFVVVALGFERVCFSSVSVRITG